MVNQAHQYEIEPMMKRKTKQFALAVIGVVQSLKRGLVSDVLARQLIRSGTSVGANYRSACRAKSKADMAAKLAISEEEADESLYWIELLIECGELEDSRGQDLISAGEEILRVLVSSIKTLRGGPKEQLRVTEELAKYRSEVEPERAGALQTLAELQP